MESRYFSIIYDSTYFHPFKDTFKFTSTIQKIIIPNAFIDSIIPSDFNYDGKLDVLVVFHTNSSPLYQCYVYYQKNAQLSDPEIIECNGRIQPFIADVTGDMQMSIVGVNDQSAALFVYTYSQSTQSMEL